MLGTARPLPTIHAEGKARFTPMESLIAQWQPDALVVGIPFTPMAPPMRTRRWRCVLRASCGGALACWCSRWTSATAPPKRWPTAARDADAASACIILEQFMRIWMCLTWATRTEPL
ncbi:Holliday junction resolvase RuvX [Comamonas sp. JC664]|uniref:Holliday junction resolvase RuvX n=1 Tax=Comamonas sp. JC664 TaxID=2801917 RepID=UPI00361FF49D